MLYSWYRHDKFPLSKSCFTCFQWLRVYCLCFHRALVSYLWSSNLAQGPGRRTCTSRWPEHFVSVQMWRSHSGGSLRQTTLCCAECQGQSPGHTRTLWRKDKRTYICVCKDLIFCAEKILLALTVAHIMSTRKSVLKMNPGYKSFCQP